MNREVIRIDATDTIPHILLDGEQGLIEIAGKSIMMDAVTFYRPIVLWCSQYVVSPCQQTTIKFRVTRFNTRSSIIFYNLFKIFDTEALKDKVTVQWIVNEEDGNMICCGEDFQSLMRHIPFQIIEEK